MVILTNRTLNIATATKKKKEDISGLRSLITLNSAVVSARVEYSQKRKCFLRGCFVSINLSTSHAFQSKQAGSELFRVN